MLSFVIPTNDRPKELSVCVRSIAKQIADDTEIVIIDNGSLPETNTVIERLKRDFPSVRSIRHEENIDYSVAHKRYMEACPDSDWVWTFGDDDVLMRGALKFMLPQLERLGADGVRFVHVAEVSRSSSNGCYRGKLLDLCATYGWLEMTGFMTGNIIRGNRLFHASQTKRWDLYAKSAFVHSCALLEELRDDRAAFLDIPLINTQSPQQTNECLQKWISQRIPERYLYCAQAIDRMFEDSILTRPLPPVFFRYLHYHLWDRFITHFAGDFLNHGTLWQEECWASIALMVKHISDPTLAQKVIDDIEISRGLTTLLHYMTANLDNLKQELRTIAESRETELYPRTFIGEQHGKET